MKTCNSVNDCKEKNTIKFRLNQYQILECEKCKHQYTLTSSNKHHVEEVYSNDYFFSSNEGYFDYLSQQKSLVKHGSRYAKVLSKYCRPSKILDIGCASGFILKGFADSGWECTGIEPNETMCNFGKNNLGLNILNGSFEEYEFPEKYDAVLLIQVIGHFYNLDAAIQKIQKILNPGGVILIESWNRNSIYARLLGKKWHEYNPPSVLQWFSDETLTDLMSFYNFKLVKKGLPLKKITFSNAISLLENKFPFLRSFSKILPFKNLLSRLNIIYPPLDVKWYIFKKTANNINLSQKTKNTFTAASV